MTVLLVAAGAAVGAPLRYLIDRFIQTRHDSVFPWGTFTVNIVGSFVLGLLIGAASTHAIGGTLVALFGTGLCGAFTTYSTFAYETLRLAENRTHLHAVLNIGLSVICGLAAAATGWTLTTTL